MTILSPGWVPTPGTESGWTITNPFYVGTFTLDGNNIDLTLTAVPEPSTWVAGGLAFAALAFRLWVAGGPALLALGYSQRRRLARITK